MNSTTPEDLVHRHRAVPKTEQCVGCVGLRLGLLH